jgi:hypothetical protein
VVELEAKRCDRSIGLKRSLHRREDAIATVKCYCSIKEGAIAATEVRSRFFPNEAIVCVSNYRSYELSEDRVIAAIERECDRLEEGVRSLFG